MTPRPPRSSRHRHEGECSQAVSLGRTLDRQARESDPRYHVYMIGMRHLLVVMALAAPAAADTFGGFSGVQSHYLVDQDKVCMPLPASTTAGAPRCEKTAADVVA